MADAKHDGVYQDFEGKVSYLDCKPKLYSLMPFFLESKFTSKSYVTRMQLYPQGKIISFDVLNWDRMATIRMPIDHLIPITRHDYWCAHGYMPFFKQHNEFDLEMIYANRNSKHMFVFDKTGEWNDEGVYHDALSMENTFNETNWYDEFNPSKVW